MSLEDLMRHWPKWSENQTDPAKNTLLGFISLTRNLTDFPFHHRASEEERAAVRQRIVQALKKHPDFAQAEFYEATELGETGIQMLAERFLTSYKLDPEDSSSGLFLSRDHGFAVTVNLENHLQIRAFSPEGSVLAAWEAARELANTLHTRLGFAFHKNWGYLSPSLKHCGNGLQLTALLDMPADTLMASWMDEDSVEKQLLSLGENFHLQNMTLGTAPRCQYSSAFSAGIELMAPGIEDAQCQSLYPGGGEQNSSAPAPLGFLRILTTRASARKSERYLAQKMETTLKLMARREEKAQQLLLEERADYLHEYATRCIALIRECRYLGLKEALICFSILRLAERCALLSGYDAKATDTLLFAMQRGHLSNTRDLDADDPFALAEERAVLFKTVYGEVDLVKSQMS
ncbi:MAG: hypothetical protein GX130_01165 [Candidatus Hydrogenedens sp.]|jgi:protein arginine kinase|nr:hypothetical protein [Candidatus Hydrogenedens sp.]